MSRPSDRLLSARRWARRRASRSALRVRGDLVARARLGQVCDAFDFVEWRWIVVAVALNLVSVVARALSWH